MGMFSSPKPFRKNVIKKFSSKLFKEGVKEKEALAEEVGKRGFSKLEFEKELKDDGYIPKRREKIMDGILGKKEEKAGLTIEQEKVLEKERNEKIIDNIRSSQVSSEWSDKRQGNAGTGYDPTQKRTKESSDKIIGRIKADVTNNRLGSVGQKGRDEAGYAANWSKKPKPTPPVGGRGSSGGGSGIRLGF